MNAYNQRFGAPFRWRLLVFDDEHLELIVGYETLTSKVGLAPRGLRKAIGKDDEVWFASCEDGLLLDVAAFRYVKTARCHLEEHPEFACDFALLDWKDLALSSKTGAGFDHNESQRPQLMGVLLGLALRRRNPKTSLALISAYTAEAAALFEASWARAMLLEEPSISSDWGNVQQQDKPGLLQHDWLREQERAKVRELLRTAEWEDDRILLICSLVTLEQRIREAIKTLPRHGQIDGQNSEHELLWRRFHEAITSGQGLLRPGYVFPFSFAHIASRLVRPFMTSAVTRSIESCDLAALSDFCTEVAGELAACRSEGIRTAASMVSAAPWARYEEDGLSVPGFHLTHFEAPKRLMQADVILRQAPQRLAEFKARHTNWAAPEDFWRVFEEYFAELRRRRAVAGTEESVRELATWVSEQAHASFRWNVIAVIFQAFGFRPLAPVHVAWDAFSVRFDKNVTDDKLWLNGWTDAGRDDPSFFLYGVRADAQAAMNSLASCCGRPALLTMEFDVANHAFMTGRIRMEFVRHFGERELSGLAAGNGDFSYCLKRLGRYFSVSVGSKQRQFFFPIHSFPESVEEATTTVIVLRFEVSVKGYTGQLGCCAELRIAIGALE